LGERGVVWKESNIRVLNIPAEQNGGDSWRGSRGKLTDSLFVSVKGPGLRGRRFPHCKGGKKRGTIDHGV